MKEKLLTEIEIPEGINVLVDGDILKINGPEGDISREFKTGRIELKVEGKKIILSHLKGTKTEKRMINTLQAHIKNMIKGVQEKFEYQLKICFGHFPFTVKQEGNLIRIKNFLGEKVDRVVKIPEGIDLEIGKEIIKIKSVNKEIAGQAAANFETVTRIRGRDKRIFQDGIYIINKAGKEM
jgi:large subunit ribosomal protein L6